MILATLRLWAWRSTPLGKKLLVAGSELASSAYAEATREALAMHIIEVAKTGERDVIRLRDDAVAFVLTALQRKQASSVVTTSNSLCSQKERRPG